jgi:hypothetical protein
VKAQDSHKGSIDYFKDIQPILEAKCTECHRGESQRAISSSTPSPPIAAAAIKPGHPDASELIARITSDDEDEIMPPKGKPLTKAEIELLTQWIKEGAHWPDIRADHLTLTALADDLTFLRRVYLDTVGVPPSLEEIEAFEKNPDRQTVIDTLLNDPRWADNWMGYWLDVLAENPKHPQPHAQQHRPLPLVALRVAARQQADGLLRHRTAAHEGQRAPRRTGRLCHRLTERRADGGEGHDHRRGLPRRGNEVRPLPRLAHRQITPAGSLRSRRHARNTKEIEVPKTSSVPMDKIHASGRKPLIQVTLQPGTKVQPKWPFASSATKPPCSSPKIRRTRAMQLAAMITAPQNERFAQVIANRVWSRFMGRGIVEPVEDWEKGRPTHPELLKWLGRELVRSGYDAKHLARLILNSHAYQRATDSR